MSTFLSLIGILAIILFLKFYYDEYTKKEKLEKHDEKFNITDESQEIFTTLSKTVYVKMLRTQNLSAKQIKDIIEKLSKLKYSEARQKGTDITKTVSFEKEEWTREYFDNKEFELRKRSEAQILNDFLAYNNLDSDAENLIKFQNKNRIYPEYYLADIESPTEICLIKAEEILSSSLFGKKVDFKEIERLIYRAFEFEETIYQSDLFCLLADVHLKTGQIFEMENPTHLINNAIKLKQEVSDSKKKYLKLAYCFDILSETSKCIGDNDGFLKAKLEANGYRKLVYSMEKESPEENGDEDFWDLLYGNKEG
jgi:hypothetical protein